MSKRASGGEVPNPKRLQCAPTISVVSPVRQVSWKGGTKKLVRWRSSGVLARVDIDLRTSRRLVKQLATAIENEGQYECVVPAGLTPGSYHIRVRSRGNDGASGNSARICVDTGCPKPSIHDVTAAQDSWKAKTTHIVQWQSSGEVPQVNISLLQEPFSRRWCFLKFRAENTGQHQCQVPVGLPPGPYKVRVESTANDDVFAEAQVHIVGPEAANPRTSTTSCTSATLGTSCKSAPSGISAISRTSSTSSNSAMLWRSSTSGTSRRLEGRPTITVVSPVRQVSWKGGTKELVRWRSSGVLARVDIDLRTSRCLVKQLATAIENQGQYECVVPAGLTPGSYHIRVRSRGNDGASGNSARICVDTGCPKPSIHDVTAAQDSWKAKTTHIVQWQSSGEVPRVNISLLQEPFSRRWCFLKFRAENTGQHQCQVPVGLPPGPYKVRVESTANDDVFAEAQVHIIGPEAANPRTSTTSCTSGTSCPPVISRRQDTQGDMTADFERPASQPSRSSSPESVSNLKTQVEALKDKQRCKVCYEQDIDCVLLGCRHAVLCQGCADALTVCPVCRQSITSVLPIFM